MSKSMSKRTVVCAGLAFVLIASAFSTSAYAAPADDDAPDRIIYVDGEAPRPAETGVLVSQRVTPQGEVRVTKGTDFPVTPAPGETIQIIYKDAVTTVITEDSSAATAVAVAEACTKSLTAYTPYKSGSVARFNGAASISSGCSSGTTLTVGLYDGWLMLSSNQTYVSNNGYTSSISTSKACASSTSTSYYGISRFSSGGSATGPQATLACRY